MGDSRGLVGIIPLVTDPASLPSAISGAYRLWEAYSIDEAVVLASREASGSVERLEWWLRRLGIDAVSREVIDLNVEALEGEGVVNPVRPASRVLDKYCGRAVVLLSSASRRLASILAAASLRRSECSHTLVHNDFYFGPWTGLHYPYVPVRLEPLLVVHPVHDPAVRGPSAGRAPRAYDLTVEGSRLPPLRASVAELARRVNSAAWMPVVYPGQDGLDSQCGRLKVSVGWASGEANLCSTQSMERLAGKLSVILQVLEQELGYRFRSVLAWTGLANLKVEAGGGARSLADMVFEKRVIADTSLVYYGLHRYHWEGARVEVPDCAIREIHRKLAETLKRGHIKDGSGAMDVLAYLALEDILWGQSPVIPSPPGSCDTSITKIDPILLEGKAIATADDGAYRYWSIHPSSRLASPAKVYFTPEERPSFEAANGRIRLARIYYSIYQALIVLALLQSQNLGVDSLEVTAKDWAGGEQRVTIPVKPILNTLGLKEHRGRDGG